MTETNSKSKTKVNSPADLPPPTCMCAPCLETMQAVVTPTKARKVMASKLRKLSVNLMWYLIQVKMKKKNLSADSNESLTVWLRMKNLPMNTLICAPRPKKS